jgi:hypothetical protein
LNKSGTIDSEEDLYNFTLVTWQSIWTSYGEGNVDKVTSQGISYLHLSAAKEAKSVRLGWAWPVLEMVRQEIYKCF